MPSLLCSDSLMRDCPDNVRAKLVNFHHIDELLVEWLPGKTTQEIIGPNGLIHGLMKTHRFDQVFLVSGANDFNRNTSHSPFQKAKEVADTIKDLIHSFCQLYPYCNLVFAPIPTRQVCQVQSVIDRFPESGSRQWIATTNDAIGFFQNYFSVCRCHSNQARSVVVSSPIKVWSPFLSADGLHLTSAGKSRMVDFLKPVNSSFSLLNSQFPPLPRSTGGFTFEPQVSVPKMKPRVRPQHNHSLFVHSCVSAQNTSFRPPKPKSPSPLAFSQSPPKSPPIKRAKRKCSNPVNAWSLPLSVADPDFFFPEPNHLPKPRPGSRHIKRPKDPWREKPQQAHEKLEKQRKKAQQASSTPCAKYPKVSVEEEMPEEELIQNSSTSVEVKGKDYTFGVENFGLFCSLKVGPIQKGDPTKMHIGEWEEKRKKNRKGKKKKNRKHRKNKDRKNKKKEEQKEKHEKLRLTLRRQISCLKNIRSKHVECDCCNFVHISNDEKIPQKYHHLIHTQKVLRVHLQCNDLVLDERILHVAKCTKVQYLVDFLRVELKQQNVFLSLHNKTLFTDSLLFDYPILNNDTLVVNCTGLMGGAPKDSWKCESCKKEFSSQEQLDKHNSDTHPERVAFLESTLMANYMKDQVGKDVEFQKHKLKCDSPNCDFTANDQRVLANHRRTHAKKGFSCNICGIQLKTKQSLSRHSSTHTSNENPVDKSSIPKKKTSSVKASVCDQMDQVYPINGKHKCTFCGKGFDQLNTLALHQQSHNKLKSALKQKLKNKENMQQKRKDSQFLEK